MLAYLFLPIFVIVLYSFNKPAGKFNFVWKSFSLDTGGIRSSTRPLYDSMKLSLRVAASLDRRGDRLRHAHRAGALPLPVPRERLP